MTDDIRKKLKEINWDEVSQKLLYYVRGKIKKFWVMSAKDNISRGVSAEDIVHDAITKTLSGERVWNPQSVPNLLFFLKRAADSLLNNHLKLDAHKLEVSEQASDPDDPAETISLTDSGRPLTEDSIKTTWSAETIAVEKNSYLELQNRIFETVKEDQQLEDFALVFVKEQMTKPQDIAEFMKTDVKEVYRLKEKFKRVLKNINY